MSWFGCLTVRVASRAQGRASVTMAEVIAKLYSLLVLCLLPSAQSVYACSIKIFFFSWRTPSSSVSPVSLKLSFGEDDVPFSGSHAATSSGK